MALTRKLEQKVLIIILERLDINNNEFRPVIVEFELVCDRLVEEGFLKKDGEIYRLTE